MPRTSLRTTDLVLYFFHTVAEINECLNGTDNCEQICTNTLGSFVCSCNEGFELEENGFSCKRKWTILAYYSHLAGKNRRGEIRAKVTY